MAAPHSLEDAKRALRRWARARRASCDPAGAGERLRDVVLGLDPQGAVAAFWSIGSEIDTRPLLAGLQARGHTVLLPVTPPPGGLLGFRPWHPGQPLVEGRGGTREPPEGPDVTPDWVLVPLLAFDRAGRRLGYGGGYYDRTLPRLPQARLLGIAYAAQEVSEVPAGPRDFRLPRIATDHGLIIAEG